MKSEITLELLASTALKIAELGDPKLNPFKLQAGDVALRRYNLITNAINFLETCESALRANEELRLMVEEVENPNQPPVEYIAFRTASAQIMGAKGKPSNYHVKHVLEFLNHPKSGWANSAGYFQSKGVPDQLIKRLKADYQKYLIFTS